MRFHRFSLILISIATGLGLFVLTSQALQSVARP
jgi:hypothetical protein